MGKGFYRAVTKELRALGFEKSKKNFKGSHERWVREEDGLTLCVPYNLKSRHTANGILSDAGSGETV